MSKLTILPKQCLRAKLSTTVSAIILTPAPGREKRIPRPHAQIIRLLARLLAFAPRSPQVTPRTILQRSDFPCPPCSVPSLSRAHPFHLVGIYPHAPCSAYHSNHARLSHQMPSNNRGDSGRRPLSPHLKILYVFSIFQNRCSASHLLTQRGSDPTDQMSPPESSSWTRLAADIGDDRSTCHAQTRLKVPQKRNGRIAISRAEIQPHTRDEGRVSRILTPTAMSVQKIARSTSKNASGLTESARATTLDRV